MTDSTPTRLAPPELRPGGRPTDYTDEIGDQICDRLFEGETVREICADPAMPHRATLQRWLAKEHDFSEYYDFTLHAMAEELLAEACTIADNVRSGCFENVRGGKVVMLSGRLELARARLRARVRCWVAYKLLAKAGYESSSPTSSR